MTQEKKFSEMNKEEKKEFVARNKARSAAAYLARQEQQKQVSAARKAFKQKVHQGNKFLDEQQEKIAKYKGGKTFIFDSFSLGPFDFSYGILPIEWDEDFMTCEVAYTIKSPTDKYSERIAKGLIGNRIMLTDEWYLTTQVPRYLFELGDQMVKLAINGIITSRVVLHAPEIPQRVINVLFNGMAKEWDRRCKCTPCAKSDCPDCNPQ